ncbi:uncharacterized protein HLK63_F02343 [Nakaseomyces glabratus]|nr:uncharacterized protein GW608_F02343 [Nakaseomyces glabratus]UCS25289.1 uncharacterized protein HLK63_F02343 [Nakaseomyces glabratus]UCS30519.1 uncharacterized protein HLK64_F02343 [Nakaseomyces glabratus]UCS35748.1 uncharacterized protein HLK62_F02343 [Nakaseomyces glabratus]
MTLGSSIDIASTPKGDSETESNHSTFNKIIAIYTRDFYGKLYAIEIKKECTIEREWQEFYELFACLDGKSSMITNDVIEFHISKELAKRYIHDLQTPIKISEYQKEGEQQIRGCVSKVEVASAFNDWFIYHVLDGCRLENNSFPLISHDIKYDEIFTSFFEQQLKNSVVDEKWYETGREYFKSRVRYFTQRYRRIECILPAFPCKSSNKNKVFSTIPDKGEELALKRLIFATQQVRSFYPPGMKVWIVSDGHVFSDCIGVDDEVVSEYTSQLHTLYKNLSAQEPDAIGFCGLKELLFEGKSAKLFKSEWVAEVEIEHHTGTNICKYSDLCRQILMCGCDTDAGLLKKQISTPGHPRLFLFRGFSKFMMEDLALLPYFQNSSRKAFKKTISKIAFNMIKRNDAYSNLVELVFPHHLRISIHAHVNSGPKFGIKVIAPEQCRTIKSLENIDEPKFEDLLHIPTPWHNCIVKIEKDYDNGNELYMIKSKIIKDVIDQGKYVGYWEPGNIEKGKGGHFILKKTKP